MTIGLIGPLGGPEMLVLGLLFIIVVLPVIVILVVMKAARRGEAARGGGNASYAGSGDTAQRLQDLEKLRVENVVSEEEYQEKRKEILADL